MPGLTLEAVAMIVIASIGATVWIVSAINGVRDAVNKLAGELRRDLDDHEIRIKNLEDEVWQEK